MSPARYASENLISRRLPQPDIVGLAMPFCSLFLCFFASYWTVGSHLRARTLYAVKETHYVPAKWINIGSPDPTQSISLQIGLKQGDFDELEGHLYEVSDPDHARYGQHLSKDDVEGLVRPDFETTEAVEEWLADNGINHYQFSPAGDWIYARLSIADVERLLRTRYATYQHRDDGATLVRTTECSLPRHPSPPY